MSPAQMSPAKRYENAEKMNAIAMVEFPKIGKVPDTLRVIETTVPRPKAKEVAIELKASSMHVDEIYAAQGTALGRFFGPKAVSQEQPYIMGSSVSGTIVGLGQMVSEFSLGDEVIVIPNTAGEIGSWATYRCVPHDMVLPKPKTLSHVQAAAQTMATCVAWGAIANGSVRSGDRCLVVGASGAIGMLMVQVLKSQGAHVTGVCSQKNINLVLSKGADQVIDYTTRNFGDLPKGSFDSVFDTIGGQGTERNAFKVLKRSGRFVTIVGPVLHIGERKLSWLEFFRVVRHIIVRYCTSRVHGPRYIFSATQPRLAIRNAMAHMTKHNITMPIEREIEFDLEQVKDAIRLLASHRTKGRIVINFEKFTDDAHVSERNAAAIPI